MVNGDRHRDHDGRRTDAAGNLELQLLHHCLGRCAHIQDMQDQVDALEIASEDILPRSRKFEVNTVGDPETCVGIRAISKKSNLMLARGKAMTAPPLWLDR